MHAGMEVGNRKDNGERLVDFCAMNNLVIGEPYSRIEMSAGTDLKLFKRKGKELDLSFYDQWYMYMEMLSIRR